MPHSKPPTSLVAPGIASFDPRAISRPHPSLLTYYLVASLRAGPAFPVLLIKDALKYHTLTYRFDDEGVSMSWGLLFRHEINLAYRRIQDIHLTRNIVERWMGLSTLAVQTASGSSSPELTIQGILEANELRDFLYMKMRGAETEPASTADYETHDALSPNAEALALLREIRDLIHTAVERRTSS